ncbi:MAG: glycosyltransferase [Bacteroidota bacterium]|nr:glycosyltransferase [Bacteroidota bacterium]
MKIIIIGTAYPLRGGIAHFNALLANHLSKRHEVETITFKRQYPKLLFPGKTQEETGEHSEIKPAPELIDSINPLNWFSVAKEISNHKPDLLIFKYWMPFFSPCFGTIARRVKKKVGAKVLFICDNIIPHERRLGDIALTKYAFHQADYFIVQSDAVEKDLLQHFPNSIYRKIPHPVYENFGSLIPKNTAREILGISNKKVILYFGYIRKYKGLMVLIDAMKEIKDRGIMTEEILLLAVGEFYDDESKYRQKVKDLNLGPFIRFVSDYVPNEQVAVYFSAADVVVLPYLSATQSGIIQIAYNFQKSVIATNVGGLAEVVLDGKTGFVVPPDDPSAIADAIQRFYSEKREEEFSKNVEIEKKKYSWDRLVMAIEEMAQQSRD